MVRQAKATVLVIDDDNSIRAVERHALEEAGHHVLEARDGAEALELLRAATEPLVALVDLMMPGVSGFDLLRTISEDWELSSRHAYVVVTANATSLPVVQALRSSFVVQALTKPFDLDALLDAVDQAAVGTGRESQPEMGPGTTEEPATSR